MARAKNNFIASLQNKAKKQPMAFLVICVLLITLPIGVIMVLSGVLRFTTAAVEAHAYFSRTQYELNPDTDARLLVTSETHEISFVRLTVTFDPTQVQLRNEVSVNPVLGTLVSLTSASEANQTGKVVIVAGIKPGETPPLGTFEVATFPFQATSHLIQAPLVIDLSDSQLIAYDTQVVTIMATDSLLLPPVSTATPTIEPTFTPVPTIPTTPTPTPSPAGQFELEAENGIITLPMTVLSDSLASNQQYVVTQTKNRGSDTFRFQVTSPDEYVVWARVLTSSSRADTFSVLMDGQNNTTFEAGQNGYSNNWQWVRLNRSDLISKGKKLITRVSDPVIYNLSVGTHNFEVRGREAGTRLDKVIITNNLNFVPSN